jgi:choline-sulfatase
MTRADNTDRTEESSELSRRNFLLAASAAAAAGLVGCSSADGASAVPASGLGSPSTSTTSSTTTTTVPGALPWTGRGGLDNRPNFLIVMVDEMRAPSVYESAALTDFRTRQLPAQERLKANGVQFSNHYTMSVACQPSRTSIFTGTYPSLHGVSQTSGGAKADYEWDMYYLDPSTVPTMGDYFRAGGYRTYYKGKWHLSLPDIFIPGTTTAYTTYDSTGMPIPENEAAYVDAERLEEFGFSSWIGPEPFGRAPLNSGSSAGDGNSGRDVHIARMAADLIGEQSAEDDSPWLIVSSFVNPHDISLWGTLSLLNQQNGFLDQLDGTVPTDLFDAALYAQTVADDLSTKPSAQQAYRDSYKAIFQPTNPGALFQQFYYQLHKTVDANMTTVLDALAADPANQRDTIVLFLSDHGDMLGAHGGMFQKWYTAYEEAIRVPFVVHCPTLFPEGVDLDIVTSHADILPTMLGLAGLDAEVLREELSRTHSEAQPLVGRDLSGVILGEVDPSSVREPVYFMTDDDVGRGSNQNNWMGTPYQSVTQPNHVETVIVQLPTGLGGEHQKWKYSRYFDSPQFWTTPGGAAPQDVTTIIDGAQSQAGSKTAETTVKTTPATDEFEVYNLGDDPLELINLAGSTDLAIVAVIDRLARLLTEQCSAKRQVPQSGTVPGQTSCQS